MPPGWRHQQLPMVVLAQLTKPTTEHRVPLLTQQICAAKALIHPLEDQASYKLIESLSARTAAWAATTRAMKISAEVRAVSMEALAGNDPIVLHRQHGTPSFAKACHTRA